MTDDRNDWGETPSEYRWRVAIELGMCALAVAGMLVGVWCVLRVFGAI